mmetsp:Transcript_33263/g.88043  ORF Transcript_33263/g.88043 Transcript_33263/m.88043 type:complete len:1539 (-) Transcript_33263:138-4754(-)
MPILQQARCCAVLAAALLALVDLASAQVTPWADVCTAEEYSAHRSLLCPPVFTVSSLSFDPHGPKVDANLTLILQPSVELPPPGSGARTQFLDIILPGFEPLGPRDPNNADLRIITVTGYNLPPTGEDVATAYNTYLNGVFLSDARYDITMGRLRLTVRTMRIISSTVDTEVRICCMRLPVSSAENSRLFTLEAPTSETVGEFASIRKESIKSTPLIDPGFQWEFLQVMFNPPVSMQQTVISITVRPANDLASRARVVLKMPQIERASGENGVISFNTAGSGDGTDWMLFDHEALWNETEKEITFFLREYQTFGAGRQVTLHTEPGEFRLPVDLEANARSLTVEARSFDGVDQIIQATSVMQSSQVPYVLEFKDTELSYSSTVPYSRSDVTLKFRTNRPVFAGKTLFVRLAGFRSPVIDVPLTGAMKHHFQNEKARYHLPENVIELKVNRTLYSNEYDVEITFMSLNMPAALYRNDASLLLWNSDPDANQQPCDVSPEVGGGQKTFIRSQISFDPPEPRVAANVTFTIQPSIVLYQGDQIVMHLYGFLCNTYWIPLGGPGAAQIDGMQAQWFNENYMLIFTVAKNRIVTNDAAHPLIVSIGVDSNFRLPALLSRNDGTLRLEARSALMLMPELSWRTTGLSPHVMIETEQLKKVPQLGDTKYVLGSSVNFVPIDEVPRKANQLARIQFSFVLNCDMLPSSTINITLGGIYRDPPCAFPIVYSQILTNPDPFTGIRLPCRSDFVRLSGANAPLFEGQGYWDQHAVTLVIKSIPKYVYAGELVSFFIERDMWFRLPSAAYTNDPSYRLAIPGAGIAEQGFQNTTKFAADDKSFGLSRIFYGDEGSVWYPGNVVALQLEFAPNVNLPGGSIIRVTLPGFIHPTARVELSAPPPQEQIRDRRYLSGNNWQFATWNQLDYSMDILVPLGDVIQPQVNVIKVFPTSTAGFMLPTFSLEPNDPRLTITCIKNQRIYEEPIRSSPRVVRRTFEISEFIYRPPVRESIFLLQMKLMPAVNITPGNPIIIELPGFRNSLSKQLIEVRGADRFRIASSMGRWNESTQALTLQVDSLIEAFTVLDLRLEESQGFILPARLDENDPRIMITSVGNIEREPIKKSPMVGNAPSSYHWFCMNQYEVGVRSRDPICPSAVDCMPPLTDPCNPVELTRCGCNPRLDQVFNLTVQGFNLRGDDQIYFLPQQTLCGGNANGPMQQMTSPFSPPLVPPVLSESKEHVAYYGISSTATGYFRLCYIHSGIVFDIGNVAVRPSCKSPQVLVGGTCVEHCPRTKIPIAGECVTDEPARYYDDAQAYMMAVRMAEPDVADTKIFDRSSDDAEVRYFKYRYVYELARLLNADPKRIEVVSLSQGSVLVNTVFQPVGTEEAIAATTERSPMAMISLLQALRSDTSSLMYTSPFFKTITKPDSLNQVVTRHYLPPPIPVRLCKDGVYRVMCPYGGDIATAGGALSIFVLGVLVVPLVLTALGSLAWRIDFDHQGALSEDIVEKLREDPRQCDLDVQAEYARSWLEGRFTGEEWQRARHSPLALGS